MSTVVPNPPTIFRVRMSIKRKEGKESRNLRYIDIGSLASKVSEQIRRRTDAVSKVGAIGLKGAELNGRQD